MSALIPSIQIVLGVPSRAIRQEKNKEIKLSLFADNMILCIENPTGYTHPHKTIRANKKFSKIQKIQNQYVKIKDVSINSNEQSKLEFKKTIQFTTASKRNVILINKVNKRSARQTLKTAKQHRNKDLINGNTSHVHGSEDLIFLGWQYSPN